MALTKLNFRPGINRESTPYSAEGGWYDADKVRFRSGHPEKIGGWTKIADTCFLGTCRSLHTWVTLDGETFTGVGTHLKFYLLNAGAYYDITPIRFSTIAGAVTFKASRSTLSAAMDSTTRSLTVASTTGFPVAGTAKIGAEQISYTGINGSTITGVTRGINGTGAASHPSGIIFFVATLVVNSAAHGGMPNDFVTFSGAASLGGNMTASVLNQEYQIVTVIDANNYTIYARTESTISSITTSAGLTQTLVYANLSDTGNGGASVAAAYQVNTGLDTTVSGSGWGAGVWGRGGWGSAADISASEVQMRVWTQDNYGEDLVFGIMDAGVYYWDRTFGTGTRGVAMSSLTGAKRVPTVAHQIMLSDRDRHILAFGVDSEFNPGAQDPLLIRFSASESLTDWASLETNTAGELRISSGSTILMAVETKQQVLVFTDVSLHSMQFIGPPFTFGINMVADGITVAGPMAATSEGDSVYWMGIKEFFVYTGGVQQLPCDVLEYVFGDFNSSESGKVFCQSISQFSEIWWFYPSKGATDNNRYVVYNYAQQIWYYGSMARTAWIDAGVSSYPYGAGTDHYLYQHEVGFDDGSTSPASPITAYVESSMVSIGEGDDFAFLTRILPDLTFMNSSRSGASADFTIKTSNFPGGAIMQSSANVVTKSATLPVERYTDQLYIRLRGRSFIFRIGSSTTGVAWRLGSPRVDVKQDGRR